MPATATFSVKSISFPRGTFHGRRAHLVTSVFSGTHGAADVNVSAADCGLEAIDGILLLGITNDSNKIIGGYYDAEHGELILIGAGGARLGAVDITDAAALWLAIGT